MMYRLILMLLILAALEGCGAHAVGKDFAFKEGGDTGLLVISTRMIDNKECHPPLEPTTISLPFVSQGNDNPQLFNLIVRNPLMSKDFHDPDGFYYILEAKAGTYRFSTINYISEGYETTPHKLYTFKVYPNQVNYLGEWTVEETSCHRLGVGRNHIDARLTFRDQSKRDEKLFRERVPSITDHFVFQKIGQASVPGMK